MKNIDKTTRSGGYSENYMTITTTTTTATSKPITARGTTNLTVESTQATATTSAAISAKSTPVKSPPSPATTITLPPVNFYSQQQKYNNHYFHQDKQLYQQHQKQRQQQQGDKGSERQQHNFPHQHQYHHHPHHSHHLQHQRTYNEKSATTSNTSVDCGDLERVHPFHSSTTNIADNRRGITTVSRARSCFSQLLQVLFSTPGLVLLVILYSMMGGLLFPLLEAPHDSTKSLAIAKSREECLRELWIITEKLNVLYEQNWTMLVHEQLRRFEGTIVAASRHGGLETIGAGGNAGEQFDIVLDGRWTFSEALLYSLTIITTIGHGSLTPKTSAGKVATILYALIGVPLMLMCLSSLGVLLADSLQFTYARICCRFACGGREESVRRQRQQRRQRLSDQSHENGLDYNGRRKVTKEEAGSGGGGGEGEGGEKIRAGVRPTKTKRLTEDGENLPEEKHEMLIWKNGKYDAVVLETNQKKTPSCNLHGATTTIMVEDSCTLPYDSSLAVNHSSPCKQQNASAVVTPATNPNPPFYHPTNSSACVKQTQQQQQQHPLLQHQHQQLHRILQNRPHADAFHARTSYGATINSTTALPASFCVQRYSPAMMTSSYYGHSLTPSAEKLQQHLPNCEKLKLLQSQQQQQQNCLYQIQLQHPQPQQQQYQQFIAVPSNILQFQKAETVTKSETASPDNGGVLNFYQSVSGAPTCAATIYVPIVAASPTAIRKNEVSAAVATTTATETAARTTAMTITNHGMQFLYNTQPSVKYNTLQLQNKKLFSTSPLSLPPPSYFVAASQSPTSAVSAAAAAAPSTASTITPTTKIITYCDNLSMVAPLPPPPAYQTASVHGFRRAKFLTKSIPSGMNTLRAEEEMVNNGENVNSSSKNNYCIAYDDSNRNGFINNSKINSVLDDCNTSISESTTIIIPTTKPSSTTAITPNTLPASTYLVISPSLVTQLTATNSCMSSTAASETTTSSVVMITTFHPGIGRISSFAGVVGATSATTTTRAAATTTTAATRTTATTKPMTQHMMTNNTMQMVDIMEDEEENEGHRLACPHGTPSRIPLISSSKECANDVADLESNVTSVKHKESLRGRSAATLNRGPIGTTAGALHRHTLHTFHRGGNRKSVVTTTVRNRNCNLHRRFGGHTVELENRGGCYGDTTETSDDDYDDDDDNDGDGGNYLSRGGDDNYNICNDESDDNNDDDDDDYEIATCYPRRISGAPQVPITMVLIILVGYIGLGTAIFASWENWSFVDGAYFCFVTLSTIGYGDFLPKQTFNGPHAQLIACCAYLLLGLVLVAMSFSILETQLMWKCRRIAIRLKLVKD